MWYYLVWYKSKHDTSQHLNKFIRNYMASHLKHRILHMQQVSHFADTFVIYPHVNHETKG
jgi:hypothetical protein